MRRAAMFLLTFGLMLAPALAWADATNGDDAAKPAAPAAPTSVSGGRAAIIAAIEAATAAGQPGAASTTPAPAVDAKDFEAQFRQDSSARPKVLLGLYAASGILNALDVASTHAALAHGAVEGNPGMRMGMGGQMAAKLVAATGAIVLSERMWKHNKAAAIATMVVANGALAMIAAHNAHNAFGR